MAWNIVRHAFAMIFNNFGQALRVTVVPTVLLMLAWIVFFVVSGIPLAALDGSSDSSAIMTGSPFLTILLMLALIVFSFFVMGWVAVAWHRFILLEEYSGFIPSTKDRPIWGYVGKSILLGLLLALISIPIGMIVGVLTLPFLGMATGPSMIAVAFSGLLIGTIIGVLWFRAAICLPAKAVGVEMRFIEAWTYTSTINSTLIGVTLIIVGLNIGAGILFSTLFSGVPILSIIAEIAVNWLATMVGISVLTTIYGHVVEGRPLSGT